MDRIISFCFALFFITLLVLLWVVMGIGLYEYFNVKG
jgi:hypothetical protein